MNIKLKGFTLDHTFNLNDHLEIAIKKFKLHRCILTIKGNVPIDHLFQFEHWQVSEILREIFELNGSKNDTFKIIPSNRPKEISDVCALFLTSIWNNEVIGKYQSPNSLKLTDVTPLYKKEDGNLVKTIDF